jgi:hypothetical protein
MVATAQAQAEATKEAQRAGIAAKANGDARAYKGRKPSLGGTASQWMPFAFVQPHNLTGP